MAENNTEGGAHIAGDVHVGSDFVGRDKIVHIHIGIPSAGVTLDERIDFVEAPPAPGRRLVGRQRELREYETLLLDSSTRLIVITGIAGIGKTTLATELHRRLIDEYRYDQNGILWTRLAGHNTLQGLWTSLAELAVHRKDGIAHNTLSDSNRSREAKLDQAVRLLDQHFPITFFDDFHRLKDGELEELLLEELPNRCRRTKLILISRESPPLSSTGKQPQPLKGLDIEGSVELLRMVLPEPSQVTDASLRLIAGKYQGHPVALEIAAGRLDSWGVDDLIDSLPVWDEKLNRLLQSVFDEDLDDQQRQVSYALAVVQAPVPLGFVEELCPAYEPLALRGILEQLQRRHLLHTNAVTYATQDLRQGSLTLFAMHDLIKDFCQTGTRDQIRQRHEQALQSWVAILSRPIADLISGAKAREWPFLPSSMKGEPIDSYLISPNQCVPVFTELDVLFQAYHHASLLQDNEQTMALLFVVDRYMYRWGMLPALLEQVENLERSGIVPPPQIQIRKARILKDRGQITEALQALESVSAAECSLRVKAVVELVTGEIHARDNAYEVAIAYYDTALEKFKAIYQATEEEAKGLSATYALIGDAYSNLGDYEKALSSHSEAYKLNSDTRMFYFAARNRMRMGEIYLDLGQADLAAEQLEAGKLAIERTSPGHLLKDSVDYARVRLGLAKALIALGRRQDIEQHLAFAIRVFTQQQLDEWRNDAQETLEAFRKDSYEPTT